MSSRAGSVDICFVGAGISSTCTLSALLLADPDLEQSIAIIDPSPTMGGVAYGERAGSTGLIISSLSEFMTDECRSDFEQWLSTNLAVIESLAEPDWPFGHVHERWLARNRDKFSTAAWANVHVPRRLAGLFLEQRFESAREQSAADVERIVAAVELVTPIEGGFRIELDNKAQLESKRVVFGLGLGSNQRLWPDGLSCPSRIADLYHNGLDSTLSDIGTAIRSTSGTPRILAIGANAACMELAYHLAYSDVEKLHLSVMSPSGRLPFLHPDAPIESNWRPNAIRALRLEDHLTCEMIEKASVQDMESGEGAGLTRGQAFVRIQKPTLALLNQLSDGERLKFASRTGPRLGRLQRRAGREVATATALLSDRGMLDVLSGSFISLEPADGGKSLVHFHDSDEEEQTVEYDIVVNCAGPGAPYGPEGDSLTSELVRCGLMRQNDSERGISVADDLSVGAGLYVIGPALAGNVIRGAPTWHTEHAGRLIDFAELLAKELLAATSDDATESSRSWSDETGTSK